MAKEEKSLVGEISTIRDILMGQQISEFQDKFNDATEKTNDLESYVNTRFEKLEQNVESRFSALEQEMNDRFDQLEELLKGNVLDINQKMALSSKTDKEFLGQILREVSGKLLNGE